jgi:hypothetical protein
MSEERATYTLLKPTQECGTVDTQMHTMRAELEELERRLIPLLVTVQKALGKEPMIATRAERRRG